MIQLEAHARHFLDQVIVEEQLEPRTEIDHRSGIRHRCTRHRGERDRPQQNPGMQPAKDLAAHPAKGTNHEYLSSWERNVRSARLVSGLGADDVDGGEPGGIGAVG